MSEIEEVNPYAPPKADDDARPPRGYRQRRRGGGIEEALELLNEHVADAAAMANDRRAVGPRIRPIAWGSGIACAVLALAAVGLALTGDGPTAAIVAAMFSFVAAIVAVVAISMDLALVPRDAPGTPEATLKSFFKSMALGRHGYAWATLCPSARSEQVSTPELEPIETSPGEFSLETEHGMKEYTGSFARSVKGTMRTLAVKRVAVREIDDEVARIDVDLAFQSWPQWVSIVMAVGAAIFRPLIIVGVILLFAMRKKRDVTVTKTMLKAQNGVWYVFDANLFEDRDD